MSKIYSSAKKFNNFRLVVFSVFSLSVVFVFAMQLPVAKSEVEKKQVISIESITFGLSKKGRKQNLPKRQPEIESHTLVGTYYSLREQLTATLMLNNKGALPLSVSPEVFSQSGTRLQLSPILVNGASYAEFDLRELLANAGEDFQEGSLRVTYHGQKMQLGSQVKLVDSSKSLIWEEQFVVPSAKFVSNRLESVWWMPQNNCETKFIISNTTDASVTATVQVDGASPKQKNPAIIRLNPHETRVLDIFRDLVDKPNGTLHTTGGISISHSGSAGAILARMLIARPTKGFSSTMNFIDPQMTASNKWHGAGLRLGIGGERLRQILVARNTGNQTTTMGGKIPYTNLSGEVVSINIPPTSIAPNSIKTINLQNLIESANVPESTKHAGIEMEYNTQSGSIVIAAVSVSQNDNQVFQLPIFDPNKMPSSAGGYPWKADGNYSTILYIKNETSQSNKFTASLAYQGGSYALGVKEIKGHQTVAIDFRELRDNQTPDSRGNLIPLNIEKGQIAWSLKGGEGKPLSGRSEQVSISNGLSSTYDCRNYCQDGYYGSWLEQFGVYESVGDIANFTAIQQDTNSYGYLLPPYTVSSANWESTEPTVSSVNFNGEAEALAAGTATIRASWEAQLTSGEIASEECFYNIISIIEELPVEISPPCPYPINFRQVGQGFDIGNGKLRFQYAWDSSDGNLSNLQFCTVGEIVTYPNNNNPYIAPSPPFPNGGISNPTIIDLPATLGLFQDTHSPPPGSFVTPYSSLSFTATQYYRFKCACRNSGNYEELVGLIDIVRSVSPATGIQWKYTITKSGASATIDPLP